MTELWFGDAVVECGLTGGPCVASGGRWMICSSVKGFDEFLGVVAWSACGFQDKRHEVDSRVSVEFLPLLAHGHEAWAPAGR